MTTTTTAPEQLEFWTVEAPMFPAREDGQARCDFHGYTHRFTTCADAAGAPHVGFPKPGAVKTTTPTAYMIEQAAAAAAAE